MDYSNNLTLKDLYCEYNKITSLDNLPTIIKNLQCVNNPFTYNFKPILENIRKYNDSKLKI